MHRKKIQKIIALISIKTNVSLVMLKLPRSINSKITTKQQLIIRILYHQPMLILDHQKANRCQILCHHHICIILLVIIWMVAIRTVSLVMECIHMSMIVMMLTVLIYKLLIFRIIFADFAPYPVQLPNGMYFSDNVEGDLSHTYPYYNPPATYYYPGPPIPSFQMGQHQVRIECSCTV